MPALLAVPPPAGLPLARPPEDAPQLLYPTPLTDADGCAAAAAYLLASLNALHEQYRR